MGKSNTYDEWTGSEEKRAQLYRRTLWVIVCSQMLGGAGLAAGVTVGALLAQDMLGSESLAGLPVGLITFGSALTAFLVGRITQKVGRRIGLGGGFIAGALGAAGIVYAATTDHLALLFISLFIYGAGTATNLQARYAGTDLALPKQRAFAISVAMVSTTLGAVLGPNLVGVMGNFAVSLGIPPLAGPFLLAGTAYFLAGSLLLVLLKPDPFLLAQRIEAKRVEQEATLVEPSLQQATNRTGIRVGALIMVTTQMVMVAIMTMTPIAMGAQGFSLQAIGMVIGFHIAGMYLPSLVTGVLVDKVGRLPMAVAAALTLMASAVLAAWGPTGSLTSMTIALILLGVGWNFGLISGTALIVDSTALASRAKTQGAVDVWIAIMGALAGLGSGIVVAYFSFIVLCIVGILGSIALLAVLWQTRQQLQVKIE